MVDFPLPEGRLGYGLSSYQRRRRAEEQDVLHALVGKRYVIDIDVTYDRLECFSTAGYGRSPI